MAERTNRKARESQRILLLDAVGRSNLYTELSGEAIIHGIYVDNFRPESDERSPYVKAGNPEVKPSEVAKIFGSECWVKEAEVRRQGGKKEPPNKQAIYLGPSRDVKHGVKVAFIDYNDKKQLWIISKVEHRALKNVRVVNGSMVLKTRPHKEVHTDIRNYFSTRDQF